MRIVDLTGQKVGAVRVTGRAGSIGGQAAWHCACDCGGQITARGGSLRRGTPVSCGCKLRFNDLAGRTFGKLTVVARAGSADGGGAVWLCRCECGREKEAAGGRLVKPRAGVMGCGECTTYAPDLTGKVFDRLTVIRRREENGRGGKSVWVCLCSCGNECQVSGPQLRHRVGNGISCGCLQREALVRNNQSRALDLTGHRFGWLTVIAYVGRDPARSSLLWRVRCDCGSERVKCAADLNGGFIVSCGCAIRTANARPPLSSPKARALRAAGYHKRRARKASNGGSFTRQQVDALYLKQRGRCAESTCLAKLGGDFHRDHRKPVVDGGTSHIHNIQLLCPPCNMKKHDKDEITWAREHGRLL